jgi:hypothetical protein
MNRKNEAVLPCWLQPIDEVSRIAHHSAAQIAAALCGAVLARFSLVIEKAIWTVVPAPEHMEELASRTERCNNHADLCSIWA